MAAVVVKRPIEVSNRLEQIGWSRDLLLEIVGAMVSARNGCTENDPTSAPGWMSWKDGTRRLREIALPCGLVRDDTNQIPSALDKVRGLRFVVANTNDGTGVEARTPQNRSKKGPGTEQAVNDNQGSMFDKLLPAPIVSISRTSVRGEAPVSWYLCVYHEGDDVRAEISCPIETEGGFFADFVERIFLLGGDLGEYEVTNRDDDDGDSEYKIVVTRK